VITSERALGDEAVRVGRLIAFALVVVGLNGFALAALFVLTTNERLLQMVGAFATSLLFLTFGSWRLRKQPQRRGESKAVGIGRALAVSVVAGLIILASGILVSLWIGPTDAEFIQQENTRNAGFAWCQQSDGHVVDGVCRWQGEDQFRLPPAPVDWTRDEEGD
jgi:hypothetical protein